VILFLDFDGVLHPQYEDQTVPAEVAFCHLPRFEQVMREFPDVVIVISSTWREQFSVDHLRKRFSPDIAKRIIDATPLPKSDAPPSLQQREAEILEWLATNDRLEESWIAVDDGVWQFKHHCHRVVGCTSFVGLDEDAASRLRKALSVQLERQP